MSKLGYRALTSDEFVRKISDFYKYQTGIGMNILIMTVISFIVGLSISGQTFYTFVLENLEKFGALKAMGATNRELIAMILFQASFTALTGYGLGIGLCTGLIALAKLRLPDYASMITYTNLALAFVMVLDHRGGVQLHRGAARAPHRTVRHLPRLIWRPRRSRRAACSRPSGRARRRSRRSRAWSSRPSWARWSTSSAPRAAGRRRSSASFPASFAPTAGRCSSKESTSGGSAPTRSPRSGSTRSASFSRTSISSRASPRPRTPRSR